MICKRCGMKLPNDSRYCSRCGERLKRTPAEEYKELEIARKAFAKDRINNYGGTAYANHTAKAPWVIAQAIYVEAANKGAGLCPAFCPENAAKDVTAIAKAIVGTMDMIRSTVIMSRKGKYENACYFCPDASLHVG